MSSLGRSPEVDEEQEAAAAREPDVAELTAALAEHVDRFGCVTAGVAGRLRAEHGWTGRVIDVLDIFSQSTELLAYMAGGRHPDEVSTWLAIWVASPLSLDQIRLVAEAGGWDPEPFVVLARSGLLERLLRAPDGTIRRVQGERAGAWVSDTQTTADDAEVIAAAHRIVDADGEHPAAP